MLDQFVDIEVEMCHYEDMALVSGHGRQVLARYCLGREENVAAGGLAEFGNADLRYGVISHFAMIR